MRRQRRRCEGSSRKPRMASRPPKPGEPRQHLHLSLSGRAALLAPRSGKCSIQNDYEISVVLSPQLAVLCYSP